MSNNLTANKDRFMRGGVLSLLLIVVAGVLWGQIIWNNLRPDDPFLDGWQPYEAVAFQEAVAGGGPVIVEVYASWCPTCIVQHQAFEEVWSRQAYPELKAFRVDYDRDQDFVTANDIRGTGILIHYRDGVERGRFAGLTSPETISAFLQRATR